MDDEGRTATPRRRPDTPPPDERAHGVPTLRGVPCPSASLAVWSAAWLAGTAAADDVLDALAPWSEAHDVVAADTATAALTDLPTPDHAGVGLVALLALARRRSAGGRGPVAGDVRVALPVAGDVRGLPGPASLRGAALAAGECMVLPGAGMALVPAPVADGVLRWTVHLIETIPPETHPSLPEAEHDLRAAVRDAAGTLADLDVARPRKGVREEIDASLRARPRARWPDGTPGRPLRVLQHADEVAAILRAAGVDSGAAVTAAEAHARSEALRPLAVAVRAARVAAVTEAVRTLRSAG